MIYCFPRGRPCSNSWRQTSADRVASRHCMRRVHRPSRVRELWKLNEERPTGYINLRLLPADGVADRVQYIDEVAGGPHFAEQRHALQHFHLIAGNIVDAPYLLVFAEIFPRRLRVALRLRVEQCLRARIRQKKQLSPIQPEHFGETGDDFVRRMPLSRFEMADVRSRGLYAPRDLFLGEV